MRAHRSLALICAVVLPVLLGGLSEARSQNPLSSEKQTQSSRQGLRAKFGDLPKDLQERAKQLGYKENALVEMQQDSTGALSVLPPTEEGRTPEEMRPKLMALIGEKIVKDPSADLDIKATLALDGTGYFTVRARLESLKDDVQAEARALGFQPGDEVAVQIDAVTWKHKVLREEKPLFSGYVQEVIPPKEPGGKPSYRLVAEFDKLPETLRPRAEDLGYSKGDAVRVMYHGESKEFEVLRPPFKFGIPYGFVDLEKEEQEEARELGYKKGETVWKTFTSDGKTKIVPASEAGDGPLMVVHPRIMIQYSVTGQPEIILQCSARFENLSAAAQEEARSLGYTEGETVRSRYFMKAGKMQIEPHR